jgi:uncharacterized membrane protein
LGGDSSTLARKIRTYERRPEWWGLRTFLTRFAWQDGKTASGQFAHPAAQAAVNRPGEPFQTGASGVEMRAPTHRPALPPACAGAPGGSAIDVTHSSLIGRYDPVTMMERWLVVLTFAAALGSALIAGVFYAFSTFIMRALKRRPAAEGMAAMQAINVAVINPLFLGVFLGTAAACAALIAVAILRWPRPGSACLLIGGALYLAGTLLVTVLFNVPLNKALAKATPGDADAARMWEHYLARWTMWNHVRTAAALAATIALVAALGQ